MAAGREDMGAQKTPLPKTVKIKKKNEKEKLKESFFEEEDGRKGGEKS